MKVKLDDVKYMGGLPDRKREADDLTMFFDDEGFRAKGRLLTVLQVGWPEIEEVTVDGPDTVQSRVTVTRLIGLGPFALAAKKKQKKAYVTVVTSTGTGIFEVDKRTPQEVTVKLSEALARARHRPARIAEAPPSPPAVATPAAWSKDPTGRHELRYWDGAQWTDHVSDKGVASTDPVG